MDHKPKTKDPQEGGPALVNMSTLAATLGVTRQWLHVLRTKDPDFPAPKRKPGSTRDLFDSAEVEAYYKRRLREPGRRTDRELAKAVLGALLAGTSYEAIAEELNLDADRVREIEASERGRSRK
jgi:predicted DNA-binding transcriptional regulator AlpA